MGLQFQAVRVEGLQQIVKDLRGLGADRKEIADINYTAAKKLVEEARPLVPVYRGTRNRETGRVYNYKSGGALARSLKASRTLNYAQVTAGSRSVLYANPIHWGWSYDKENFIEKNIKPRPFFIRAWKYNRNDIIKDYERKLQALIDKYNLGEK